MNIIRRAILAFALIAGITPAFAQAPPPIPALPDTERRTSYSISASTCACSVIDAEACKGGCRFFADAENAETTVFRIQYDADLVQPLLVFAEHFSDTADREDVADTGHGQAA
jgi:hypothetical protein